jgi:hypothetical protein
MCETKQFSELSRLCEISAPLCPRQIAELVSGGVT